MLTTAQKTKKIQNAQKRIDALQARVDRIAKLRDVSAELDYEKSQLALLRNAPVSDSTSTATETAQTTHDAGAEVTATGALPADIPDAADYVTPDDEPETAEPTEPLFS
jgi:hypothetical protein